MYVLFVTNPAVDVNSNKPSFPMLKLICSQTDAHVSIVHMMTFQCWRLSAKNVR